MPYDWRTELPGIFARHADNCPRRNGGFCICGPLGYRASLVDPETGRRSLSPDFETVAEAQAWQRDQHEAAVASNGVPTNGSDLGAVIDEFLQAAEDGRARDRGGEAYPPERLRQLRGALSYVDSALGSTSIEDVRRRHVQAMLEQLRASGVTTDRLTSIAAALRSLYAYAIQRDLVGYSPVVELGLPSPDELEPRSPADPSLPAPATYDTLSGALARMPRAEENWSPDRQYRDPQYGDRQYPDPHYAERHSPDGQWGNAMPMERVMWWAVRVVVLLFGLIALVLVAESV
jgi:Phage integrase, N-terminal SAM-like domain